MPFVQPAVTLPHDLSCLGCACLVPELPATGSFYCLPHYMGVRVHTVCAASRASNPKMCKGWKPRTAEKPHPEIHADVQNAAFISNGCGIMAALLPADIEYCATSSYVCANHFPTRSEPYPLRSHTSAPVRMVIWTNAIVRGVRVPIAEPTTLPSTKDEDSIDQVVCVVHKDASLQFAANVGGQVALPGVNHDIADFHVAIEEHDGMSQTTATTNPSTPGWELNDSTLRYRRNRSP